MNSKYAIAAVIVLAVLLGGYYLVKSQYSSPQQANTGAPAQTTASQELSPTASVQATGDQKTAGATIEYSENGFNPKSLTVKVGSTVTWVNKDTDMLWVASNPHPIHNGLPGFDALKGYKTGESFSYTFTKVGTFGYHNHLTPANTAVVVVEL